MTIFEYLHASKLSWLQIYLHLFKLGNIGGQLGLFVGASLLTIAELVEYGFYHSRGAIRRYQQKRNQRMSDIAKQTSCAEKEPLGK